MFFLIFLRFASSSEVVSDNDILMTKQTYGQCRRNLSVDGNKLTIGGKQYDRGIGTHATSMIPITIPQNVKALTGACGIDDETTNNPAVIFQISSGSEVLWSQLKKRGEEASTFTVEIPKGATKLYLLAGELDASKNLFVQDTNQNDYDHADWVNLQWSTNSFTIKKSDQIPFQYHNTNGNDFGPMIRKQISTARSDPGSTIIIPKGEYHFYASGALKMSFHVSNHDQPAYQPVAIPLIDLKDVTLDCSDSVFIFHDLLHPIVVLDSQNVTIKNVKIDYFRPFYTQGVVTDTGYFSTTIRIDRELYPYHVDLGRLVFEHEGFTHGIEGVTLYKKENKMIVAGTADYLIVGLFFENADGTCTFSQNLQGDGVEVGDIINFHTNWRPYPAVTIYRAIGTVMDNVHICDSQGMAVLSQRSEDITFINSGVEYSDETRYTSSHCDAVHFSNCRGHIQVENSLFEGMLDDSINVHSTSLRITSIDGSTITLQYMHSQSVGFETFLPNENVQFIKAQTLELSEIRKVVQVRKLETTKLQITIDGTVPSGIGVGDAVENSDYYPSVTFRNNTVRNNRARGTLFTTPKDVIVEDNVFDYTSGSALLLAGDAANWYESGASRNVIIRRNRIINALTSSYQFTNAIFSFCPSINSVSSQKQFYHTNVVIEDNYIETFDVPLLYAISSANVEFRNNQIVYNNDYPGWGKRAFLFNKVSNITITGNTVSPTKTFSIDDVSLTNTDQSEIHFE